MTTTACAIDQSVAVEIATITPGYAAVRAHRPLKGRMASRNALLGTSVMAGVFGLMAAEATAQQYNLPGSGGFTDVSTSINVVTDAGGGNIRVILSDGVQFVAGPGQYQLNPMTNQLQVSTDVLLTAYTGGAPVAAQQASQMMTATAAYAPPPVYAANAPLTLPQPSFGASSVATYQPQVYTAGQYGAQPSVVGGYQMAPSTANIAYNPPQVANLNPQATQYVPAYSAGMGSTFGGAGTGYATSTFGQPAGYGAPSGYPMAQPMPVAQAVPTAEIAMASPAVASSGGMFGLPTWALVGGGVAAAGAALMAAGSLGGGSSSSSSNSASGSNPNYGANAAAFLASDAVQQALGNETGNDDDGSGDSSGGGSGSGSGGSSGGGIVVGGGSSGSGSTTGGGSSSNDGDTATISEGSEDQTITGTSGDDIVTFEAAEDAEEFASLDLSGGDDKVVLEDMDDDLTPKDMNNVETVEIQVDTGGKTINMSQAGDDVETLHVDAGGKSVTITDVDSIDTVKVEDAAGSLVTIEDVDSSNSVALTESDDVKITSGSVLMLDLNDVNGDIEIINATNLTITNASGSNSAIDLTADDLVDLTIKGGGALTVTNDLGETSFPDLETIDGSAATGPLSLSVTGSDVEAVDTGEAGDNLQINSTKSSAGFATNGGNDNIEIDGLGTSASVNAGDGGDNIELNVVLAPSNSVDGGDGNDTLEASTDVSIGSFVGIETLELLGAAAAADLSKFDSDLDRVDIKTTTQVTLDNARADVVIETVNAADLVFATATGASVQIQASGDLTVTNTAATSLTELKVDFVGGGANTLTLLDDPGIVENVIETLTIEGTNGALTIEDAGGATSGALASTTSALTKIDASDATHAILMGVNATTPQVLSTVTNLTTGSGDDALYVDLEDQSITFTLGAGDDVLNVTAATTADVRVYGGAGGDDITLGVNVEAKVYYTSMADFESGDAENITDFKAGTDDLVIQIAGVDATVNSVTSAQSAGVASGVYLDTTNDVVYVSDGTNLGVINDVTGNMLASDIEVF